MMKHSTDTCSPPSARIISSKAEMAAASPREVRSFPVASAPSSKLTFSRGWLVHVSRQTLDIAKQGAYKNSHGEVVNVEEDFRHAKEGSVHYHSSYDFLSPPASCRRFSSTRYQVCYGSSLQVAQRLDDELGSATSSSIGILNSASARNPSKFLRGTLSQEEGFCRATLLYPCLIQFENVPHHFYAVNNKPKYQESSSSCAIFCPNVPMIREDSVRGTLLDKPKKFSFVNIPAPNAFILGGRGQRFTDGSNSNASVSSSSNQESTSPSERVLVPAAQRPGASARGEATSHVTLDKAMHDRCRRALAIFQQHHITTLVLCAFGCGVHGNDPERIAQCFHDLLEGEFEGCFQTVYFAIASSRKANFEAFQRVFGESCNSKP